MLDLRGMRCPWPAIRTARMLREEAGALTVIADDPLAPAEIAAVAAAAGRACAAVQTPIGAGISIVSVAD